MKQYKVVNLLLTSFILVLIFLSCSKSNKSINIKLIETTDVHGYIFPYDFINEDSLDYSISQVSTYVKQQRLKKGQWTVLLDNGDILQGQPPVYFSNFIDTTHEHICSKTMNYLKYDVATVGNHDIEAGHKVYDKVNSEFTFTWLAANAIDIKSEKPYFKPYSILEKKGVKIAVLGLITPAIPNWLPEKLYRGIKFEDMVLSAKKWMKIIKENEKPDIIVGLFHSGHNWNYGGTKDTLNNENATVLVAKKVPGFDIVFCGHDHTKYISKIENAAGDSVLIIDPSAHSKYIGTANINLSWNNENNKYIKTVTGEIIETKNFKPDPDFLNKFESFNATVINFIHKEIANLNSPIDARNSLFGDNKFMDLIHRVQLEISKADISFAAPLKINTVIDSGKLKVNDMFKLYKYENMLYVMELTGKEIKDYLEYSYSLWLNKMKNQNDHILLLDKSGKKLKNPFYNFDSAEGIKYTVDLSKDVGERIRIISMTDGSKFDIQKKYKVAINSYRGNGGGGHLVDGSKIPKIQLKSRIISSTEKDLRYYMIQYLKAKKEINPAVNNNWEILPKKWVKNAISSDFKLIFEKNYNNY